jgi:membrane associated rhomboid family serine protease
MTLKEIFNVSGVVLIILWSVLLISFLLETILGVQLNSLGIRPRTLWGLTGIPLAPFLHSDKWHLFSNMTALLFLGLLMMVLEGRRCLGMVLTIVFLGGLGTWLVGRGGDGNGVAMVHVGASGVVFGLMGYIFASGWVRRSVIYSGVSLIVLFFYGGVLWGMLPLVSGVSWEGHLCGFVAGIVSANLYAPKKV